MLPFTKDSNFCIVKGIDNIATQDQESWIDVPSLISWSLFRTQSVLEINNQMEKKYTLNKNKPKMYTTVMMRLCDNVYSFQQEGSAFYALITRGNGKICIVNFAMN